MSSSRRDFIKLSTTFTLAVAGDSLLKILPSFALTQNFELRNWPATTPSLWEN
ncbi:MAG: twin-arginine translocation signal domain-containing protein [Acidobacteria bacterium]|nr:twin-arginine translocation signal domain-containing protein [Acidobacteriota bacterium]